MKQEIINRYLTAFDEINRLILVSYLSAQEADESGKRTSQIIDDVLSILVRAYREGADAAAEMLKCDTAFTISDMQQVLYTAVDGKTFEDRIRDYVKAGDYTGLETVVQTEFHRVYNAAAATVASHSSQVGLEKVWVTVRDNKVRETHRYLEGVAVDIDQEFYTIGGDHAAYPGGFMNAENNVGCRCILEYRYKH